MKLLINFAADASHCRIHKDVAQTERNIEGGADLSDQLCSDERMPTDVKEVVMHAYALGLQQLLENCRDFFPFCFVVRHSHRR